MKKLLALFSIVLLGSCATTTDIRITDTTTNRYKDLKVTEFRITADSIYAVTKKGTPVAVAFKTFPTWEYEIRD